MQRHLLRELRSLMGASGTIRIGTRGSKLALWQAEWTRSALMALSPGVSVELEIIRTRGDKIQDVPLARVGGKGLFVKEIEEAVLDGRVDLAVHSMKDMPADVPEGLIIGAVPEREMAADVLISASGRPLMALPAGSRVGTSSLRRGAQVRHLRPDLDVVSLRGNLDTRLRKLSEGEVDAVILAAAGVRRMGLADRVTEYLAPDQMLPAVGQGALCIEIRRDDRRIGPLVAGLEDPETRVAVTGERAFLRRLEGGCQVPIAAHGEVADGTLAITGLVAELDGSTIIKDAISGPAGSAATLGEDLAGRLLERGAGDILERLKKAFNES